MDEAGGAAAGPEAGSPYMGFNGSTCNTRRKCETNGRELPDESSLQQNGGANCEKLQIYSHALHHIINQAAEETNEEGGDSECTTVGFGCAEGITTDGARFESQSMKTVE